MLFSIPQVLGTERLSKIRDIQALSNTKIQSIQGLYKIQALDANITHCCKQSSTLIFSLIKMVVLKWGIRLNNVRILETG